tara:strand:- start:666 stop:863 length:198 start_codon:yes stop_codon:yes gene_type:complete
MKLSEGLFDRIRKNIQKSLDKKLDKKIDDLLSLKDKGAQKIVTQLAKDIEDFEKKYKNFNDRFDK